MIPRRALSGAALLLTAASLASCTTGRQFSIAMTNPGAAQTVLVVGDDGSGSNGAPSLGASTPTLTTTSAGATGLAPGELAIARSQLPTTLDLGGAQGRTGMPSVPTPSSIQAPNPMSAVQISLTAPAVQVFVSGGVTGAPSAVSSVQANLSSLVAATSVGVAVSTGALAVQTSTPVVSAGLTVSPATGLQASLTSPAAMVVAGTVASTTAPVQATLAGVTSAVGLAAPVPGMSTPTASLLKTLTGAATKKLKHG